jgi:hypothetical protein
MRGVLATTTVIRRLDEGKRPIKQRAGIVQHVSEERTKKEKTNVCVNRWDLS